MKALVGAIATFTTATLLATSIFYTLWYIHNDRPFTAALVAGFLVTMYEFGTQGMLSKRDKRIDNLERKLQELTDEDDDSPRSS